MPPNKPDLAPCCRVLFKQRDNRFYPPSAWSLALLIVRIPFQLMEALIYSCIVYFWVGEHLQKQYACKHQPVYALPLSPDSGKALSFAHKLRYRMAPCVSNPQQR